MKVRRLCLGALVGIVALLVSAPAASAKLPPGSTFEVCGASGCERLDPDEALGLQIKLIEPAIEHGTVPVPAGERPWFRVDLILGEPLRGMTLGPLERRFPVVYSDGLVGVPLGEGAGYRWIELESRNLTVYDEVVAGAQPFVTDDLAALTQGVVAGAGARADSGSGSDGGGLRTWVLIALIAGAGVVGIVLLRRLRWGLSRQHVGGRHPGGVYPSEIPDE